MQYFAVAALLSAAAFTLTGCLEREEEIAVKPDGSATITMHITGDKADFEHGDAMPSAAGGWTIVSTPNPKKPEDVDVSATLAVGAGKFPGTFATSAAAEAISLKFPTEVWIEDRADGRYYQFRRIYQHRADARYTLVKREAERDPKRAKLLETPPEELTPDQRKKLVDEFRDAEIEKQHQFVLAGMAAIPDRPQDTGLHILAAVAKGAHGFDIDAALDLLSRPPSKERDAAIERASKDFLASIEKAVESAIVAENLSPTDGASFRAAMAHEKAMREITEDINDENFKVWLSLPGEIVASNGKADGAGVSWTFDGFALMDRDQFLMATSRVPKAK
ncbi:MAG: hypothetical protein ACREJD_04250 [Phycisphaerales bacterium]